VPKVLLEAAACGRAIVTTDMPGCREIVAHGDNGLLVPPRDAAALADALQTLLQDPERRSHMGTRGRELAVQEFSVEKVVAETLALYREFPQAGRDSCGQQSGGNLSGSGVPLEASGGCSHWRYRTAHRADGSVLMASY
jgi:hypothetical protein